MAGILASYRTSSKKKDDREFIVIGDEELVLEFLEKGQDYQMFSLFREFFIILTTPFSDKVRDFLFDKIPSDANIAIAATEVKDEDCPVSRNLNSKKRKLSNVCSSIFYLVRES